MSAAVGIPKRHRGTRFGERRGNRDPGSSQDASEEDNPATDNDNDFSDAASLLSGHAGKVASSTSTAASSPRIPQTHHLHAQSSPATAGLPATVKSALGQTTKRGDEHDGEGSLSEGFESPSQPYDGDVESSSTIGGTPVHSSHHQSPHHTHIRRPPSPTPIPHGLSPETPLQNPASPLTSQRLPTPKASRISLADIPPSPLPISNVPTDVVVKQSTSLPEPRRKQTDPLQAKPNHPNAGPPKMLTLPQELPLDDIRGFVQRAIAGEGKEDGVERWWKTNEAPEGKVVRVYADGVYDLFHFGHALQLRQAKLSFPQVHLLVGVCSDALCASHKSAPAMTHAERCESVRHCRWVDEVLPDAPWVVDQAWLDQHEIDYIAHDEEVYPSKDLEDVYAFAKRSGRFVPTRRTPAISTSDLLERIVRGYRDGFFDSKLEKNGHPELLAADVDWDSSASVGRREKRVARTRK